MTEKINLTLKDMTVKAANIITIAGRPHNNAERFIINIGQDEGDIALNFNVDFGKNVIILKTLLNGQPGHEKTLARFTFVKGQGFELTFKCSKENFTIKMPKDYTETYTNDFGVENFKFIQVLQDVRLNKLSID